MASVFGLNSSGDNNYFNSLSGLSSSNKSSSTDSSVFSGMLSGASALGDYSLIQSGAYKKLLSAYYSRDAKSGASETDKKEMINLNTANSDATALNSSVSKLMGTLLRKRTARPLRRILRRLLRITTQLSIQRVKLTILPY